MTSTKSLYDAQRELRYKNTWVHLEPYSQRMKIYRLPSQSFTVTVRDLRDIAAREGIDKLIFYVTRDERSGLDHGSVSCEGQIRGFFRGDDAFIYALFLSPDAVQVPIPTGEQQVYRTVIRIPRREPLTTLPPGYRMRVPTQRDVWQMVTLYETVFESYPTPMYDPQFVAEVVGRDHIHFRVIEHDGQIVSACSADILPRFGCAELADCATLPEHQGKGLLSYQFHHLIQDMKALGLNIVFSYSRAVSMGMNLVNVRHGFTYGGCMKRNSNIGGRLENMNIWYRRL